MASPAGSPATWLLFGLRHGVVLSLCARYAEGGYHRLCSYRPSDRDSRQMRTVGMMLLLLLLLAKQ